MSKLTDKDREHYYTNFNKPLMDEVRRVKNISLYFEAGLYEVFEEVCIQEKVTQREFFKTKAKEFTVKNKLKKEGALKILSRREGLLANMAKRAIETKSLERLDVYISHQLQAFGLLYLQKKYGKDVINALIEK